MSKAIQKHYLRIIRQWPVDHLRPVSFHDATRKRMTAKFLKPQVEPPLVQKAVADGAQPATAPAAKPDEKYEMEQVNALYSLLENRYSTMYKTSDDLLQPVFKPTYYTDLLLEMEEAPKRSWLMKKWLRWSGLVRFK